MDTLATVKTDVLCSISYESVLFALIKIYTEKEIQNIFGNYNLLSYDVTSESEIMPCIKMDKPLVVYNFSGKVMK